MVVVTPFRMVKVRTPATQATFSNTVIPPSHLFAVRHLRDPVEGGRGLTSFIRRYRVQTALVVVVAMVVTALSWMAQTRFT